VGIETGVTREHRIFLTRRFREFSRHQPELRELRRILLKLGGEEMVPSPGDDPTINFLIDYGIVYAGPVLLTHAGHRQQDRRLGRIWHRRLHGIVGIGVGYALNDDGLWREHSFGVRREGVIETLAPRRKYFGLLLIGEAADAFAETLMGERRRPVIG
jgi:hypothetical protein